MDQGQVVKLMETEISHWDSDLRSRHGTGLLGGLNLLIAIVQEAMVHWNKTGSSVETRAWVISPDGLDKGTLRRSLPQELID